MFRDVIDVRPDSEIKVPHPDDLAPVPAETRDSETCKECGEGIEKYRGYDDLWRWIHKDHAIHDHMAAPSGRWRR